MIQQAPRPAINLNTLDQISLYLLQDKEFGLESVTTDDEEILLVNEAISLVGNHNRDNWTELKQKALLLVGSPIADVVSRIASAQRNPDIALSGLRDACEKSIEIAANTARKRITSELREKFKSFSVLTP